MFSIDSLSHYIHQEMITNSESFNLEEPFVCRILLFVALIGSKLPLLCQLIVKQGTSIHLVAFCIRFGYALVIVSKCFQLSAISLLGFQLNSEVLFHWLLTEHSLTSVSSLHLLVSLFLHRILSSFL